VVKLCKYSILLTARIEWHTHKFPLQSDLSFQIYPHSANPIECSSPSQRLLSFLLGGSVDEEDGEAVRWGVGGDEVGGEFHWKGVEVNLKMMDAQPCFKQNTQCNHRDY